MTNYIYSLCTDPYRDWKIKTDPIDLNKFVKQWQEAGFGSKIVDCYSYKINDTFYYNLPGVKKDFVNVGIEDGKLNVVATGKVGEKEYNYDFSTYVGSASDYDIVATFENSVLMVEMKKKISKTTIEVKG